MTNERDLVVYVLARSDLPSLNPGKLAAQVHHSGVQMMAMYHNRMKVQDYVADGLTQSAMYFNTTLVLAATLEEIEDVVEQASLPGEQVVLGHTVTDPSYPFLVQSMEIANLIPQTDTTKIIKVLPDGQVLMVREEVTCAWFLGDRTDPQFKSLFTHLNLYA